MRPSPFESVNRRQPTERRGADVALATLDDWTRATRTDRNRLLWAMIPAALLHLALLAIHLPAGNAAAVAPEPERPLMLIREYRVKPPEPPPPPRDTEPPRRQEVSRPIPVPEIEKVVVELPPEPLPLPEIEVPANAVVVEIPAAPPAPAPEPAPEPQGPIFVSGDVVAPVKTFGPQPVYPRAARLVRVGGSVVVRATINEEGEVVDLKVMVPKPMGLTEATLDAMRRWRFEPATLNGKPVAVLFDLTVNFEVR